MLGGKNVGPAQGRVARHVGEERDVAVGERAGGEAGVEGVEARPGVGPGPELVPDQGYSVDLGVGPQTVDAPVVKQLVEGGEVVGVDGDEGFGGRVVRACEVEVAVAPLLGEEGLVGGLVIVSGWGVGAVVVVVVVVVWGWGGEGCAGEEDGEKEGKEE